MQQPDITGEMIAIVRSMQAAHRPPDAALRQDRLTRAIRLLTDHHDRLARALCADFGHRSRYQSLLADVGASVAALSHAAQHVAQWMAPEPVETGLRGATAHVHPHPLGVVGIIAPWNVPVNLAFAPLAAVFAGGNTALIKPSELTPRTSETIAELVARYFAPHELGVVLGDATIGAAFAALPFDHLIFTGSTAMGRDVMRAAAANLTPVTLELGGKCPAVIAPDADVAQAARRIMAAKGFNAGQICVAPDYLLLHADQQDAFIAAARAAVAQGWPRYHANPDYTAIISPHHYARLCALIEDAVAQGATAIPLCAPGEPAQDPATRRIAPTLLRGATPAMAVMREEIFGPILPMLTVADQAAAIAHINARPRPLAAYHFGQDPAAQTRFAAQTTTGALVFNDAMAPMGIEGLPSGGIGASGMGACHGVHGFRRFTHPRAVLTVAHGSDTLQAPYATKLEALEDRLSEG